MNNELKLTEEDLDQVSGGISQKIVCPQCGSSNIINGPVIDHDGTREIYKKTCGDCACPFTSQN